MSVTHRKKTKKSCINWGITVTVELKQELGKHAV